MDNTEAMKGILELEEHIKRDKPYGCSVHRSNGVIHFSFGIPKEDLDFFAGLPTTPHH